MNFYNEIDPFAAAWLRELIKADLIAPGVVDERSIEDITPNELRDYKQCHFFAGIGVWSYALRQAGWPDDRPVWTGSCPCQPFSAAGKRGGTSDERHLWPSLFHLIEECQPPNFFGEQVASKDGLAWFDTVQADLEGSLYAVGVCDLCAAGFGAPHIRQRLYFVADSGSQPKGRGLRRSGEGSGPIKQRTPDQSERPSNSDRTVVNPSREQMGIPGCSRESRGSGELGNSDDTRSQGRIVGRLGTDQLSSGETGLVNGVWREADWIYCRDEKYRPVEAGTFPLAHGIANRVGKLRGYGNAIVAPVAQAFIESYLEVTETQ